MKTKFLLDCTWKGQKHSFSFIASNCAKSTPKSLQNLTQHQLRLTHEIFTHRQSFHKSFRLRHVCNGMPITSFTYSVHRVTKQLKEAYVHTHKTFCVTFKLSVVLRLCLCGLQPAPCLSNLRIVDKRMWCAGRIIISRNKLEWPE
jgi:hypothetical protein